MQFGVLGHLQVKVGDRDEPATLSAARLRALLAVLLWRANRPVPADELAELVWDGAPPAATAMAARTLVMRLRRQLDGCAAARIVTRPAGYAIEAGAEELDASRFEALTQEAGAAVRAGRWAQAAGTASEALGLWRGAPLADVPSQLLRDRWVPRLEQLRMQALDWRIEADLHEGRHEQVIPELRELTARHPLREGFQGQLMLALYRSGRQAEALGAYQHARGVIVAELGVEPGPGLRDLHQRMLSADPALAADGPVRAGRTESAGRAGPERVTPRELPPAVPDFTGRCAELDALTRLLDRRGEHGPGAVVISAISGTAGVGKTALAVHFAHQVADRFGDGQLYVNLRGFDPSNAPVTPAEAVRGLLDVLGVPPERVPAGADAQAGLYRSLLADKRMLIVLDNARDEQQVRLLLPASPASLVVITSRNQLAGLAVADGARLVSLDVLPHDEAVQLLAARIGDRRAAAEPGPVHEIAALCAHLPLALAVAAARGAARPRFPLAALAAELRGATERLDALDSGDQAASVRAVFSWSYRQLSDQAARMFRLLGLHPGPDISVPAAASLAGCQVPEALRLLGELTRDCLLTEHVLGRYAFHDLLRAYAGGLAVDIDSEQEQGAATRRLLDHYMHTAARASRALHRACEEVDLAAPVPGVTPEEIVDPQQALTWFKAEHHVLLAVATLAAAYGVYVHAWQLPWAMAPFLERRGHFQECAAIQSTALPAATRLGDTVGEAVSSRLLARAYVFLGDYDRALDHLANALVSYDQLGNRQGEGLVHVCLATIAERQGRYSDALSHSQQALHLYQVVGHKVGEAALLNNVGWYHAMLGDYQQARMFCEQALALSAILDEPEYPYHAWDSLGYVERQLGNLGAAANCYQRSLSLCREAGARYDEAAIATDLGDTYHAAGELSQARDAWQQALIILEELGDPAVEKLRAKLCGIADPSRATAVEA